jgi:hypothetical protein
MNKCHWSVDIRGTLTRAHMYLRYHRGSQADNEIGFGIELMPRKWKVTHHKAMCRFNLFLWIIAFWFDYPYPIKPTQQLKYKTYDCKHPDVCKAQGYCECPTCEFCDTHHPAIHCARKDKNLYCLRCNKYDPDPKENCWVGGKLFTQDPVPHIFENLK